MHVVTRNPRYKYKMEGIHRVTRSWRKKGHRHSSSQESETNKAADMAGAVLKQITQKIHYRDKHVFKKLYLQYVRPHMEFASPVWSPWQEQDIQAVGMISRLNFWQLRRQMLRTSFGYSTEKKREAGPFRNVQNDKPNWRTKPNNFVQKSWGATWGDHQEYCRGPTQAGHAKVKTRSQKKLLHG